MIIKNADFLRTNFVIAIDFLSFIVVVKLNVSIIVFKKSLKQVKNEACQVLESFVSNIVSFLKEWRKILKGAILCRKSIEWVTLLIRSNLIMSAKKKSNLWDSQMHQKVLRIQKVLNENVSLNSRGCKILVCHYHYWPMMMLVSTRTYEILDSR